MRTRDKKVKELVNEAKKAVDSIIKDLEDKTGGKVIITHVREPFERGTTTKITCIF